MIIKWEHTSKVNNSSGLKCSEPHLPLLTILVLKRHIFSHNWMSNMIERHISIHINSHIYAVTYALTYALTYTDSPIKRQHKSEPQNIRMTLLQSVLQFPPPFHQSWDPCSLPVAPSWQLICVINCRKISDKTSWYKWSKYQPGK